MTTRDTQVYEMGRTGQWHQVPHHCGDCAEAFQSAACQEKPCVMHPGKRTALEDMVVKLGVDKTADRV
jgi:hypothetical protein